MKITPATFTLAIALALSTLLSLTARAEEVARPNIVLILADDIGFSDIASYGSEVETPNLSALAAEGMVFTNYRTAASCAPTRAMLLTGVDSHRNGVPSIPEAIPPEQMKHENYKGTLSLNVETLASQLKKVGYHTYMTGKWHLGHKPELLPFARGFERTITMPFTGADNWEQRPYLPIYPNATWFADGKDHTLPEDFYSSTYFIDKTIEFIDSNIEDNQPFFSYIPFQAVHIPVQAPIEFTDKYKDRYKDGWTALRKERLEKAKALGIVPEDTELFDTPGTTDWDSLTDEERAYEARRMAVYAGMIDAMDFHIGRLIAYLKDIGEYENTIFIFTSDNGAEGSDPMGPGGKMFRAWLNRTGYKTDLETLGTKGSFNAIGPSFATAAASPLAYFKFYVGDGGLRVPLVISGPPVANKATKNDAFLWVTDLAPTILSLAGIKPGPDGYMSGKEPVTGHSLVPILSGEALRIHDETHPTGYELGGNKALFQGDYKIVFNRHPLGDMTWHMFNLKLDPGETRDLKESELERFQQMLALYENYERENNVLPVADDYTQVDQVFRNAVRSRMKGMATRAALIVGFIAATIGFFIWRRRRKKSEAA